MYIIVHVHYCTCTLLYICKTFTIIASWSVFCTPLHVSLHIPSLDISRSNW